MPDLKTDNSGSLEPQLLHQTCKLPDGRLLSYAEFGEPSGYPVFFFHGFPGCRLEAWQHHRMLVRKRIRLICPDRPGIGESSLQPGRRYLDYPNDIGSLADHIGLEKFAVLGASGGGPYAVACARILPADRMSAVGLLAPAAPEYIEGQDEEVTKHLKFGARLGAWTMRRLPWLVEMLLKLVVGVLGWLVKRRWVINRIDWWLERSKQNSATVKDVQDGSDHDEPLPAKEQRQQWLEIFHEQFNQGTRAVMDEAQLLLQPWGYDLSEVPYDTIRIWHGSKDVNAPIQQCRLMAAMLPHVEMKEFDLDHPQMLARLDMVLDELVTDKMRQAG